MKKESLDPAYFDIFAHLASLCEEGVVVELSALESYKNSWTSERWCGGAFRCHPTI